MVQILKMREPAGSLQRWGKMLAAIVVIQLFFWLLLKPYIIGNAQPDFTSVPAYEFSDAALEAPDYAQLETAEFAQIETLPAWRCCDLGYRAFRYHFDVQNVPETGFGIAPHIRADNFRIYVNGSFVGGTGEMEMGSVTYDSLLRQIYHVPSAALTEGKNQVVFIMVRDGIPYFDYFPPLLGEYESMKEALSWTDFMVGPYQYIVLAAILIVAIFALIFWLISERERGTFWLFGVATGLALLSHYYVWVSPPFGGIDRVAYFHIISLFIPFAWFAWANSWSRQRLDWALNVAAVLFGALGLWIVVSLYTLPPGEGYDAAGEILFYGSIALSIATIVRLILNFRDLQEGRYWEAAIAVLLVSLLVLQSITELTQSLNMGYASRTQPFVLLGIAIAFFARKVRLFQSSGQITAMLKGQLDQRTAELAVAHDREKDLLRRQTLDDERQRIMADMHDGLGSNLMSMLIMAKRGKAEHADYAEGLRQVIDEMRLMIDSLETVGESLRPALSMFRKRILPRAKKAGFAIDWRENIVGELPAIGARDVLQVFRILQEAVTNAFKHSDGDQITIEVSASAGNGLTISITDNGGGMTETTRKGRGLTNMRSRAASIGGELEIESTSAGSRVQLTLPR